MTGAYIRIDREGKWVNVEIDELTDEELDFLEQRQPDRGWLWAKFLAKWIRDGVIADEREEAEAWRMAPWLEEK